MSCTISALVIKCIAIPESISKDTENPSTQSISNEIPNVDDQQGIKQDVATEQEGQQSAGNEESPVERNIDVSKVSPLQEQKVVVV